MIQMAQITMKSVCAIFSLKNQKGYNMYTFDSRIRYSEIDRSGRLSIPAVVDYFQDCSAFQSEELGVGVEYLANKKRAWILNSWLSSIPQSWEISICGLLHKRSGTKASSSKDPYNE